MKQTLPSTAANVAIAIPAHQITGNKQNLVAALKEPKFLRLFATLMNAAGVTCPLTIVAQEPVKGTPHSKGLQMHHFLGAGVLLRWHDEAASNDQNIQFMVCTPKSIIATSELFHQRVSTAFKQLVENQRNGQSAGKPNGKGNHDVTEGAEFKEEIPDVDIDSLGVIFLELKEAGHIGKTGVVARQRLREAIAISLGLSKSQSNGVMEKLLKSEELVYTDGVDHYGLAEKWAYLYDPPAPPVDAPSDVQAPALPAEPPAPIVQAPVTPAAVMPPALPEAVAVRPAIAAAKKPSVQTQLAQLIRSADEAARKRQRLTALETERLGVADMHGTVTNRLAEIERERTNAEQLHGTLTGRLEGLDGDIAALKRELDDPKLKDAQTRLDRLQAVLSGE